MAALDWIVFAGVVAVLLSLDLFVFQKVWKTESLRRAILESVVWISIGTAFSLYVWRMPDGSGEKALAYLTAFVVEKALSIDNLFVFAAIFRYFHVEPHAQRRVLLVGILSAVVLRGVFIFVGVELLQSIHWMVFVLGGVLVVTAARLGYEAFTRPEEKERKENFVVRYVRRHVPMTKELHGGAFHVRREGKLCFTPLLLVLVAIETTDILFAIDSVPAVLGVTRDRFVAYSSNVFAILGLRALYFVLADALEKLWMLRPAIALILLLVGAKMIASEWVELPVWISLATIGGIVALAIAGSLVIPSPWHHDGHAGSLPPRPSAA